MRSFIIFTKSLNCEDGKLIIEIQGWRLALVSSSEGRMTVLTDGCTDSFSVLGRLACYLITVV
jgi:hypothetical protein